jgi:hypothetical protein
MLGAVYSFVWMLGAVYGLEQEYEFEWGYA